MNLNDLHKERPGLLMAGDVCVFPAQYNRVQCFPIGVGVYGGLVGVFHRSHQGADWACHIHVWSRSVHCWCVFIENHKFSYHVYYISAK